MMPPSGAGTSEYSRIVGKDDEGSSGMSVLKFLSKHGQKIWWTIVVLALVAATGILIHAYGGPATPTQTLRPGEMTKDAESLYKVKFPIPDVRTRKLSGQRQPSDRATVAALKMSPLTATTVQEALKAAEKSQSDQLVIEEKLEGEGYTIKPGSPAAKHQSFMKPSPRAKELAVNGSLMDRAAKYLVQKLNLTKEEAKGGLGKIDKSDVKAPCIPPLNLTTCVVLNSATNLYHSTDGLCNNINNPGWGSAGQPYRRILLPAYDDGVSSIRAHAKNGAPLPHPRKISTVIHSDVQKDDELASLLMPIFGQFIDHDVTATAIGASEKAHLSCCKGNQVAPVLLPECIPFSIIPGDELYAQDGERCFNLMRSSVYPSCELGPRNQFSDTTAYLDGSVIYGHSDDKIRTLRVVQLDNPHGYLTTFNSADGRPLLPVSTNLADGCNKPDQTAKGQFCFASGDGRLNENIALTSMHLLWVRQHNHVADQLAALNPTGHDGKTFFETREIIIAQLQHVTYNEYLPVLLGKELMDAAGLTLLQDGYYDGYDQTVDASVANVFASAAYRMGHATMKGTVKLKDSNGNTVEEVPLHELLYNPFRLWQPGNFDAILRGYASESAAQVDIHFTNELTRHMFQGQNESFGLDLAAINIQRGRDHGLPGYSAWREACGLDPITDFDNLTGLWKDDALFLARSVYNSPEDVDLYSAMFAEKRVPGAMVGPTLACLLTDQFLRIKKGDRFWYESDQLRGRPIPADQLQEIRKTTLARIICDVSDGITEIQLRPLDKPSIDNPLVPCNSAKIPKLDYSLWFDNVNTGLLPDKN